MKTIVTYLVSFYFFCLGLSQNTNAQCPNPTVLFTEDFQNTPITGAITSVIYGQGNWTNASYTLSGTAHGWFNIINNVGDVDFYDRQVSNLCVGENVEATFWTRHSFGNTNVTYSLIDNFGVAIASTTLSLTTVYQQITLNATVTTPDLRLVMHLNSIGGNGNDVIVEDIVMSQCSNFPTEQVDYLICNDLNPIDLRSFFSANIPAGGSWSGPTALSNGDLGTYTPSVNTSGVYAYTPPSGATCASVLNSTVNVTFVPGFDLGNDTTLCNGANFVISAPTIFDSYTWNTAASTQSITISNANTYFVDATVNGTPNCTLSDTLVVNIETPSQTLTVTPPVCSQDANGTIAVDNPDAIEFSIDNGLIWQADSFFVNLPNGFYTVCSRSSLGCEICETVQLDTPPVSITVSGDTIVCENGTVNLVASANGGNSFEYNWNFTTNLDAFQNANPQSSQTYTVFAENELGCTSSSETTNVTVLPPLSGSLTPNLFLCEGDMGTLVANANGGSGFDYSFNWSTGDTQTGLNSHSISVNPTSSEVIDVTLSDNCESTPVTFTTTITVNPLPNPEFALNGNLFCEPASIIINDATTNVTVQNVDWTIANNQIFSNQSTITTASLYAGSYPISMTVTSTEGCVNTADFIDVILVEAPPTANFSHNPDPVTMFNTTVSFTENSSGAENHQWYFPGAVPSISSLDNPIITYPDGIASDYLATLIAISAAGCTDTITEKITVYPDLIIYAPNTFTPDADEYNPTWRVFMQGIDIYAFNLTVYNRWGQLIWENNDINVGWDATYNGKKIEEGVYLWRVKAKEVLTDKTYEFNGHVNVLK